MSDVQIGSYTVGLSNQDKTYFPEGGLTKGDLVDYYRRVAEVMLPHLEGRPLVLRRYPDGIAEDGFVQQEAPDHFPDWIDRVTVEKEGGTITHVVCNSAATLVYLANQGCITPHAWLSCTGALRRPDRLIFDLDPPDGDIAPVRQAARRVRDLLTELGLAAFVMTSGSRGLHVVAPLKAEDDFETVRTFAHEAADVLAARHPDALTTAQRKDKRQGRVFLDYLRNSYAQTSVPPYAARARPGAPAATPLAWDELSDVTPRRYTITNLFRRLGQKDDPWHDIDDEAASLETPQQRLRALQDE